MRKDILRNSLSDLRARSTGVYHHNGHDHSIEFPKLKVDFEELKQRIRNTQEVNMRLENLSVCFNSKIICYEDFENWDQTISSLLMFIGVTDMPLKAATQKLNPDNLEDRIENYAALKKWLLVNRYDGFADT